MSLADWQSAFDDLSQSDSAAAVTFTLPDGSSPVTGFAIQRTVLRKGAAGVSYDANLAVDQGTMLFFVRDVYDVALTLLNYIVLWAGEPWNVKGTTPIAPDGMCIASYVMINR